MNDMLTSIAVILGSFLVALALTAKVRAMLLARDLLDRPNERSSHSQPVPRGGGWALVLILIPALAVSLVSAGMPHHFILFRCGLIVGTLLLAFISWQDDRKGVSAGMRLLLHIAAACLGSLLFRYHQALFGGLLPFWLDRVVMIVGWAWFMNLYNFMDGIDGITGVETISIATGACLVMSAAGISTPYADMLTLVLTGACLGFLAFNWHPAKIFLGDIGSVPLGFLTGFLLIGIAVKGFLIPALILPLYYIADSGITITKRALRGEKIWQPHRQHFYQRAAQRLGRHDYVVYRIIAANIALAALAVWGVTQPWPALAAALVVVAILLRWMHKSEP